MVMKKEKLKIFVYGDSNTWGYVPTLKMYDGNDQNTERYNESDVWWSLLKKDYTVFSNGNNGRTINNDHEKFANKNALKTLERDFVESKIDLVIIMLGTNDFKDSYNLKPIDVVNNMDMLVKRFIDRYQCKIMLIAPPLILDSPKTKVTYNNGVDKIRKYCRLLEAYTKENGYLFLSGVECEVGIDGEHLTKEGHKELGQRVLERLKEAYE